MACTLPAYDRERMATAQQEFCSASTNLISYILLLETTLLPTCQILPETHALGQFHPHSLILEITVSSRPGLEDSLDGGVDNQPAQILAHELCHWTDLVGTVWGQEYLDVVFAALDHAALDPADKVASYPDMLQLFDRDRAILFPSYYKVVNPDARPTSEKKPWEISFSCGAWFDPMGKLDEAKPIFFVRFDQGLRQQQVARQPLTVGALLELRATAAEIATIDQWLPKRSLDEQAVATAIFRRERIENLYDPQLTTYSAAAHLLSFCTSEPEFTAVCTNGAALADVCLNVVAKSFSRLRCPEEFHAFTPQRLGGFRTNQDRGYLFACLAFQAKEIGVTIIDDQAVSALVKRVGLGSLDTIYDAAERYFDQRLKVVPKLRDSNLKRIREKLGQMGREILFRRRTRSGRAFSAQEYIGADLPSPVVMTNDCEEFIVTSHGIMADDGNLLHEMDSRVRDRTRDALRAGRGLDFGFRDYVY